jgi:hypothetical protein
MKTPRNWPWLARLAKDHIRQSSVFAALPICNFRESLPSWRRVILVAVKVERNLKLINKK